MLNMIVLAANDLAQKAAKRAGLVGAAIIMAIVFMLVLPMPIWLLDVLIAVNLAAAGLMVIVSMYMPGPTAFSTFPAVLLLTTLFRLALEVSTSRQILLEANAGHIVETFGNFVVGGNLIVGLVVFLILTVVQFIVITKGSERVSEVAARFTLDAMPGKQMSIDSDLRAGLLSPDDAKRKRAELAKESQLHGAMDGAMKFVKGDSIAGLFIVAVNLIGGIAIGVTQKNLTAGEALQVYSVLSIGDALIAQIPALLISLAAGMITTRVSDGGPGHAEEGATNIGQDIVAELFGEPKALATAGGIMLLFAFIPGMPASVFLVLALLMGGGGAVGLLRPQAEQAQLKLLEQNKPANTGVVDLTTFSATRTFLVRMPASMANTPEAAALTDTVRVMRNGILEKRGIPDLEMIQFEFHDSVPQGRVQFLLAEVPLIDVDARIGWAVANESVDRLRALGFNAFEENVPGSRRRRTWVQADNEEALRTAGIAFDKWEAVFAEDVGVEMLRNCHMFIGVQEVQRFARWAERCLPELGKELARTVPLSRLAEVMQRLAKEGVSMRNPRLILETVLEWATKEGDPDILADYVRHALKRQLCFEVSRDGLIEVLMLSPELEDLLREALRRTSHGTYFEIDIEIEQKILDQLGNLVDSATPTTPPVLVTASDIRRSMRSLIEGEFFSVPVLAFSELIQNAKVQPLGMIEI